MPDNANNSIDTGIIDLEGYSLSEILLSRDAGILESIQASLKAIEDAGPLEQGTSKGLLPYISAIRFPTEVPAGEVHDDE